MDKCYTVFDVETPNGRNDRICSIGITLIDNDEIGYSDKFFVNPESAFERRNISIHRITPDDVKDSPAFPELWAKIHKYFENRIIVAHNAYFDLNVLKKSLNDYQIKSEKVCFVDTLEMAREILDLDNNRLDTLSDYYNIELNHHDSESDCLATAKILLELFKKCPKREKYEKIFSFDGINESCKVHSPIKHTQQTQSLLQLKDILKTISFDRKITLDEFGLLRIWMDNHADLRGCYPYDLIFDEAANILEDGFIEDRELDELFEICNKALDPVNSQNDRIEARSVLGKKVVLSGEFIYGNKTEIAEMLVSHGAEIQNNVTKKTNIVLVGGCGNISWSAGNYGNKIKKALELKEKGIEIEIVKEADLFLELEDKNGAVVV